jgi:hypothetical protein
MDGGPKNSDHGHRAPKKRDFRQSHDCSRDELQLFFRNCVLFNAQFLYQSKAWKSGFLIKSSGGPKIWTAVELKSWFFKKRRKIAFYIFPHAFFFCVGQESLRGGSPKVGAHSPHH